MSTATALKDLYNKLGYLYYGLASADNPLDGDGLELLKKTVHRQWEQNRANLPEFQPSSADNVDTLFDWLMLNETPSADCIREFNDFIRIHGNDMDDSLKAFTRQSARNITGMFGQGQNSSAILDAVNNI